VKHAIVKFQSSKNIVWIFRMYAERYGACDVRVVGLWLIIFGDYAIRD